MEEINKSRNNIRGKAYELIAYQKKELKEVKEFLLEQGMDEEAASMLIGEINLYIKTRNKKAKNDMEIGLYLFLFGIIITGITYLLSDYLRFYIVTWGFIISGAILYIKGLSNRIK